MKTTRAALVLLGMASLMTPSGAAVPARESGEAWRQKVDPWVLEKAAAEGSVELLLVLDRQADLRSALGLHGKEAKGRYVYEKLRAMAEATQPLVIAELERRGLPYQRFFVVNMIWTRARLADLAPLAGLAGVARLSANPVVALDAPVPELPSSPILAPDACPAAVSAGVVHTGAPDLWAQGVDGTGVVLAGADTGYAWDHPALKNAYRGWNGVAASHDYNWHDSIHSGGGSCGADSPFPCDDNNHGTHTLGTMLGDNGAQIQGMAPGARWIGCRNMNQGNGTPATYAECYQFFLAPTDLQNQHPDPAQAPDAINNSWSCPVSEGCTDPNVFKTLVENLRAAGIMVLNSAGNSGSACSSINNPPGIYDALFTVGSTDNFDVIAGSSSRGPVTVDGSGRQKPDVTGPGVQVCSTVPGGYSESFSGTSMATPHVTGLVALLISAQPCLRGEVDAIENYIRHTAVPRTTAQNCTIPGSQVPNNTYGWGAIRAVLPTPAVCPVLFADGFESGSTGAWSGVF